MVVLTRVYSVFQLCPTHQGGWGWGHGGRKGFVGFYAAVFFGILSGAVPQLCDGCPAGNHYGHSSLTPRSVTDWSGTACKGAIPGILAARSSGDHRPEEQWT